MTTPDTDLIHAFADRSSRTRCDQPVAGSGVTNDPKRVTCPACIAGDLVTTRPLAVAVPAARKALGVIVLDKGIRAWLLANDPKALEQADDAFVGLGGTLPTPVCFLADDGTRPGSTRGTLSTACGTFSLVGVAPEDWSVPTTRIATETTCRDCRSHVRVTLGCSHGGASWGEGPDPVTALARARSEYRLAFSGRPNRFVLTVGVRNIPRITLAGGEPGGGVFPRDDGRAAGLILQLYHSYRTQRSTGSTAA